MGNVAAFRTFVEHFGGPKEGFEAGGAPLEEGSLGELGEDPRSNYKLPKYMAMLQEVANLQRTELTIELDDLLTVASQGHQGVDGPR